ncbi:MAG: site-specific integrase [Porphyromonadaceae bacterium]|nr:MAG: site-specific integrase [Porphyromonadaceae bacterium]
MKRATFKVMFYLKRQKVDANGEVPIFMRVTVNGIRAEIAIQRMIRPKEWDQAKGRSTSRSVKATQLNDYLQQCQNRVYEVQKELEHIDRDVTAASIKARYNGADPDKKYFLQELDGFINKKAELVGKEITKPTIQKYRMCYTHLQSFLKQEYKEKDIAMSGFTYEVLTGFDHFLRAVKNQQPNTAVKTMRTLKGFIQFAENNEWINRNPFDKIKMSLKPVDRGYLTIEELNLITDCTFKVERLQQVADVFIFCCYTGLAYSDVKELTPGHLIKLADGSWQVSKKRRKTKRQLSIPLLKTAQSLVEKYQKHPCRKLNRIFPVLSNQKMNAYLKEVGDLCGITKEISSHLARHTFATTVALANNMPIEVLSQILGHSTIPMTQHYARMNTSRLTAEMKKLDLVLDGTNNVDPEPMKALWNVNPN